MQTINARKARESFSALLDEVAHGQEMSITRHGEVVAHLVPPANEKSKVFPDLTEFRKSINVKPGALTGAELVRKDRGDI